MPNNVTTIIKSSNQSMLNLLKDFNKIIPEPEIFNEFGNSVLYQPLVNDFINFVKNKNLEKIYKNILKELYFEFGLEVIDERAYNQFILQAYCFFQTGYKDPIDWSIKYWGTKWNSYDFKLIDGGCKFDTAWNHPLPIIRELSKMFPCEEIEVLYADEDLGRNLGHYKIKNTIRTLLIEEDFLSHKEKVEFAIKVKGKEDQYIWQEDKNEYIHILDLE